MKVQLNRVIGRERVLKFHLYDFEGSHRDVKEKKKKNIPIRFMFYGNKLFLKRFKIYSSNKILLSRKNTRSEYFKERSERF